MLFAVKAVLGRTLGPWSIAHVYPTAGQMRAIVGGSQLLICRPEITRGEPYFEMELHLLNQKPHDAVDRLHMDDNGYDDEIGLGFLVGDVSDLSNRYQIPRHRISNSLKQVARQ